MRAEAGGSEGACTGGEMKEAIARVAEAVAIAILTKVISDAMDKRTGEKGAT